MENWGVIYVLNQHYINICTGQQYCMLSKYFQEAMGFPLRHDVSKPPRTSKIDFKKSPLSIILGHILPENCLQTIFFVVSLSEAHQDTCPSVQLSKALIVLPAPTKEAFMAYVRKQFFRNHTWVHSTVEGAGSVRHISRFLSGPYGHPATEIVYPKVVRMIWVSHGVIKIQYKPDVFISHEILWGRGKQSIF